MTFPAFRETADAVSGVAEIPDLTHIRHTHTSIQIACEDITGTGTVTITVKPAGVSEYQSITDGEIALSDPIAVVINGQVDAVKATSSSASDAFTLVVGS